MALLLAWLGNTDLRASETPGSSDQGPILSALRAMAFDGVHLLSDHGPARTRSYAKWLNQQTGTSVTLHLAKLASPTSHEEIYRVAVQVVEAVRTAAPHADVTFHLSPGTPAMAAIWLLLAKTRYPARLIESSREQGVNEVAIPFELSAEYTPSQTRAQCPLRPCRGGWA